MTTRAIAIAPSLVPAAPSAATAPRILRELAAVGRRVPVARKLLVGPDVNFVNQLGLGEEAYRQMMWENSAKLYKIEIPGSGERGAGSGEGRSGSR